MTLPTTTLRADEEQLGGPSPVPTVGFAPPRFTGAAEVEALWDAETGRFYGAALRRVMVVRGWTADDFAEEAGISRACAYGALAGRPVRLTTVVKVFNALRGQPALSTAAELG